MIDKYSIDYTALLPDDEEENEQRSVLSELQTDG
jgi:hypothetical protein